MAVGCEGAAANYTPAALIAFIISTATWGQILFPIAFNASLRHLLRVMVEPSGNLTNAPADPSSRGRRQVLSAISRQSRSQAVGLGQPAPVSLSDGRRRSGRSGTA